MKIWFITGASRGFGALVTTRALAQGDAVVAPPVIRRRSQSGSANTPTCFRSSSM